EVFSDFNSVLTQAQYTPYIDFDVPSLMATVKNYFPIAIKLIDKTSIIKHKDKKQVGRMADA
ncbi:MAG: hypothetical protein JKX98_03625, partial [Alcanivoracaceae bacterium]|nr:hypothetical protein [Alcanivoracaceae bacterium]